VITNSSLTAGTLAVGTSGDGRLDVPLAGNVDLLKLGKGTVSVAGWQKHTGRTVLEGGTLSAVTNLCVDAVNGLVLHFDASRPETMTLDADNRVRAWRAVNDPSLVLTNCCAGENVSENMRQYMADCPIYRVTGIAGQKPAVEFGHTLSGALSPTILKLGETGRSENVFKIRHRTAMVVHYPDLTGQGSMTPYGRYYLGSAKSSYNYGLITSYPNASVAYGQSVWGMGTNEVYINARKVCDVVAGTVEEQYLYGVADPSLSTYGSPHVVTVAIPDITPALPEEEYRPIVGSSRFIPYNDGGSLTYTREYRGKICEILVFDRYLPDNERRMIETCLLHKWLMSYGKAVYNPGVCRFEQSLSPFSSVEVTGDATLDFGGIAQSIPSLKLAAGAGRAYPTLTLAGAGSTFDLTGIDFDLSADNPVSERQTLLDGGSTHLTGPFKTVPMLSNGRIRYRATTVGYSTGGFTVLIR